MEQKTKKRKIIMIEFLKHATGMCGEPHPSLLTMLYGSPIIGYVIYRVKNYGKEK